jgi:hypothetical protein
MCGVVLTHLSGMSARCSRDMAVRREIDRVVHEVRTELAQACTRMADERGEPPLISRTGQRWRQRQAQCPEPRGSGR